MPDQMTNARRAQLQFKQAMKHDADGNEAKADEWLAKACESENKAKDAGEPLPVDI